MCRLVGAFFLPRYEVGAVGDPGVLIGERGMKVTILCRIEYIWLVHIRCSC